MGIISERFKYQNLWAKHKQSTFSAEDASSGLNKYYSHIISIDLQRITHRGKILDVTQSNNILSYKVLNWIIVFAYQKDIVFVSIQLLPNEATWKIRYLKMVVIYWLAVSMTEVWISVTHFYRFVCQNNRCHMIYLCEIFLKKKLKTQLLFIRNSLGSHFLTVIERIFTKG